MKFRKLVMCGIFAATTVMASVPTTVSVSAAKAVIGGAGAYKKESAATDGLQTEGTLQTTTGEASEAADAAAADEESEWENRLLVVVDEETGLNIRSEAGVDAEVVGRLERGDAADVVEKGEEWTKIVSGDVEGYVKNEYCLFESEAEAQAAEVCGMTATATTDGLRIRSEANTESTVLGVLDTGDEISAVVSEADSDDGQTVAVATAEQTEAGAGDAAGQEWIQVEYQGRTAYVSAQYVEVALNVGEAQSMEEIEKEQAARAAAKKSAQSSAGSVQNDTGTTQGAAVSATTDDATLLAAIIQCEAGSESYEGQVAVGAVVMNRVKSASFPNSISGVIYQSGQFTPAFNGKLSRVLSNGSISASCYQAANAAISGADNTGGALYFHAGSGNGLVIGNQVFY